MQSESIWFWVGFNAFILGLLAVDLGIFHRKAHAVSIREAGAWLAVWVSLALAFNVIVLFWKGRQPALEFLTGYILEESLSVDNMFIFVLIFATFTVPPNLQHRVLFWGILGALIMRGAMIIGGSALLQRFEWVIYIFGAFLIFTGARLALQKEEAHPERNPVLRLARRFLPVTEDYHGQRFFVRLNGRMFATPLLLVLIVVETTDLVFALDSIPAIFAITRDPFIVYTSNVFAILGLRSLYFLLAGAVQKFYYLRAALSVILVFVGIKMVIGPVYHMPVGVSLATIASVLAIAMIASVLRARRLAQKAGGQGVAAESE